MSIAVTMRFAFQVTETLTDFVDASPNPNINHTRFDKTLALDAAGSGSTGPVVANHIDDIEMVAGLHTVDLTALPQSGSGGGGIFDATTMKVQGFRVEYPTTNSDTLTIGPGAADPYEIFGGPTQSILLFPGGLFQFYYDDKLPDISATAKDIDFTGVGTGNFLLTLVVG